MNAGAGKTKIGSAWLALTDRLFEGRRLRIYIIPTWFSFLFNLLLLFVLSYGFSIRSYSILGVGFLILFIELLSMIESHVNLRDLVVEFMSCPPVESNAPGSLKFNAQSKTQSYGVRFYAVEREARTSGTRIYSRASLLQKYVRNEMAQAVFFWRSADASSVLPEGRYDGRSVVNSLQFTSLKRGVHPIPKIIAVSMFPFGMFRVCREFSSNDVYFAYPRPMGVPYVMRDVAKQNGEARHGGAGRPGNDAENEYQYHREFMLGDPLGRIDWKASSRRGVKIVKFFGGQSQESARTIDWNETRPVDAEVRLEQLSYWIQEAHQDHVPFRLVLPDTVTTFGSGHHHKMHCLSLLAAFDADSKAQRASVL